MKGTKHYSIATWALPSKLLWPLALLTGVLVAGVTCLVLPGRNNWTSASTTAALCAVVVVLHTQLTWKLILRHSPEERDGLLGWRAPLLIGAAITGVLYFLFPGPLFLGRRNWATAFFLVVIIAQGLHSHLHMLIYLSRRFQPDENGYIPSTLILPQLLKVIVMYWGSLLAWYVLMVASRPTLL